MSARRWSWRGCDRGTPACGGGAANGGRDWRAAARGRPPRSTTPPSPPFRLTLDQRYQLARSVGAECVQESELRSLLDKKPNPVAYDGFEPSGRMHIAQGVMKALNVNKLTRAGVTFKFWCGGGVWGEG